MKYAPYILLSTIFLIKLILTKSNAEINVDNNSQHLIDSLGRVRIFHGVNIVVKNPPYTPETEKFDPISSLSEEDYDYLIKFGFNMVRLGLIWEAVETSPGNYNMTYLDIYENIINKLGSRGIYTILDSHQDMFSRFLCGEGVPIFYAKELLHHTECNSTLLEKTLGMFGVCHTFHSRNITKDENDIPLVEECKKNSFVDLHQVVELSSLYHAFFQNFENIQDKFINYWKVLAKKFRGNKYIIGYDIWNEPWVGNLMSNYENFIPGHFTNEHFLKFYKKVDEELRKVDDDFTLMFEEALFPDTLPFMGGFYLGGYKTTPAKYKNKQIWSWHHYCKGISVEVSGMKHIPLEVSKNGCYDFAEYKMRTAKQKANELGVSVILTEFGACDESVDEGETCYYEIAGVADACDKYQISWAYWMYKPFGDHTTHCEDDAEGIWFKDGKVQEKKLKALTRPYFMAFQGTPIKSFYFTGLELLYSKFVVNLDIDDFSIVYINREIYFKNGLKFLFVSHEVNQHLIADSQVTLIKTKEIVNTHNNDKIEEEDFTYVKFKISPTLKNNNNNNFVHKYFGFSFILENTVEFLLAPQIKFNILNRNENLLKQNNIKNIKIIHEDLNQNNIILNREIADNVIIVEYQRNIINPHSYVLIDYKNLELEDLENFNSSIELIKPIEFNKQKVIDLVYINKMIVKIILNDALIYEVEIENMLNHFIKILIE